MKKLSSYAPTRLYSSAIGLMLLAVLSVALIPARPQKLFADYQSAAAHTLQTMTLDEKIAQTLLVRYPDDGISELEHYQFGGYVFFERDFRGKTADEVRSLMDSLQSVAKIPILTAVDEEGGSVTRISNNRNLTPSKFLSPQELYDIGGMSAIAEDTIEKSHILNELGLNLNLAPVVDVSTDPHDYMYQRSLGQNADLTAEYAATVIRSSQGTGVSYTLKHFPGYGDNLDTHQSSSFDARSLADLIRNDLPPFSAGIDAGAEAILVSHNIVGSIDAELPASLSPRVHQLLREAMHFTGVIITDDISMAALDGTTNPAAQALLAGNDLIITTDYKSSLEEIKTAILSEELSESVLDGAVLRILAWKYAKGLDLP